MTLGMDWDISGFESRSGFVSGSVSGLRSGSKYNCTLWSQNRLEIFKIGFFNDFHHIFQCFHYVSVEKVNLTWLWLITFLLQKPSHKNYWKIVVSCVEFSRNFLFFYCISLVKATVLVRMTLSGENCSFFPMRASIAIHHGTRNALYAKNLMFVHSVPDYLNVITAAEEKIINKISNGKYTYKVLYFFHKIIHYIGIYASLPVVVASLVFGLDDGFSSLAALVLVFIFYLVSLYCFVFGLVLPRINWENAKQMLLDV